MKKLHLLSFNILILFFQSHSGFCQVKVDYKPGTIITANNEEIRGWIKNTPYDNLSHELFFKKDKEGNAVRYQPGEIKSFNIDSVTSAESIRAAVNRKHQVDTAAFFAVVLVQGEIDLLMVVMKNTKKRFFVRSTDFGISELEKMVKTEGNYKSTNSKYHFVLAKYMFRKPELQDKITIAGFNKSSLVELIELYNYNSILENKNSLSNKIDNVLRFNVGGVYYLGAKLERDIDALGYNVGFSYSIFPVRFTRQIEMVFGIDYKYFFYNKQNVIFWSELESIGGIPGYYLLTPEYAFHDLTLSCHMIESPIYISYNNKMKKLSPIVEMGFRPYLIKSKAIIDNSDEYKSDVFLKGDFILGFGLGLNFKRFSYKYLVYAEPYLQNSISVGFDLY